ncbi:MAG: diadenylate cyclase CdaA [Bacillota bacterium]|nr:diadenylate cyclase CdaA [Bacillota bacterium]
MQYINSLVAGISFTDIIDIAIISYIVYKLLGFIRSSRAEQLAKGILFLILIFILSGVFHLYALNWILKQVLSIGLIALIIVFQPELRRGLEYIGRETLNLKKIKEGNSASSPTAVADAIAKSIAYFASISEGALIVMERQTALSDIAESGTILDAQISEQLLENIFYVGSPLHDGAVIIRDDRVYAAACMLPLTENPNLSKDLGTRHRAAIGITEQSDALVFVVSEETGIISMVEDGKISRFLDVKAVEKTLLAHYMQKTEGSNGRRIFAPIFKKAKEGENDEK